MKSEIFNIDFFEYAEESGKALYKLDSNGNRILDKGKPIPLNTEAKKNEFINRNGTRLAFTPDTVYDYKDDRDVSPKFRQDLAIPSKRHNIDVKNRKRRDIYLKYNSRHEESRRKEIIDNLEKEYENNLKSEIKTITHGNPKALTDRNKQRCIQKSNINTATIDSLRASSRKLNADIFKRKSKEILDTLK